MIKRLGEFFQEDNGGLSSTRLIFILGSLTIFFTWAFVCVVKREFAPFDPTHVGMVTSLGALKFGQKFTEQKVPNVPN